MFIVILQVVLFLLLFLFAFVSFLYIHFERPRIVEDLDIPMASFLSDQVVFPQRTVLLPSKLVSVESRSDAVFASSRSPSSNSVLDFKPRVVANDRDLRQFQTKAAVYLKRKQQQKNCGCHCDCDKCQNMVCEVSCDCSEHQQEKQQQSKTILLL